MVVCAALLAVAINSVGGHHRDLITIFGPLIGAAFIGTGLFAWLRRPENRVGALMVALGFGYCLSALIVTTESWTFIAGLAVIALPYAILSHVLLAFPSGRLGTRGSRTLAAAIYLVATVGWWTCMLFQDTTRLDFPANPLLVADEADLFSALARIRLAIVAALIGVLGVVLVRRWSASTPSQRRALAPVYLSGGLVLALYGVWSVLGVAQAAPDLQETLEYARVIALAAVPFAFLAGLLRSRVAAAAAVSELVARLGAGRGALRDSLADALGDPTLRVAYWLPERAEWVDADGAAVTLPAAGQDGTCTPVSSTASRWPCSSMRRRPARSASSAARSEAPRELRELARGIHPAVLSDRGLGSALEALAGRLPLPIEVAPLPPGRLPEPLEAAVYFVVAEALTNVARYAHATHARVELAVDGDVVDVQVADDGIGGADPAKGSGLRGLADRVAALDGRLEVESEPGGGTTVRARIPRAPQAAALSRE